MEVLYEDNHIIVVNKAAGELVQADPTGDYPLVEMVRDYIRETCHKPGNVFVGSPHRLDRPTWGLVVMTRTTKGLVRMTELFRERRIHKTYWAIVCNRPPHDEGELTHYLVNMKPNNKTYAYPTPRPGAAKAVLRYRLLASGERYHLLEAQVHRHHRATAARPALAHTGRDSTTKRAHQRTAISAMTQEDRLRIEEEIVKMLRTVYDPEIPVDVYSLGLIYKIDLDDEGHVDIDMTLTAPTCPMGDYLFEDARMKVESIEGVTSVNVNLVFEPEWTPDMMSDEARLELGMM